jgi:hypothetical protein
MSSFSLNNGVLNSVLYNSFTNAKKYNAYEYPYMSSFVADANYRHVKLEVTDFSSITTDTHILTDENVLRKFIKNPDNAVFLYKDGVNKISRTNTNYNLNKPLYLTFYLGDYRETTRPMNVTVKNIKIYVKVDPSDIEAFKISAKNAYIQQ